MYLAHIHLAVHSAKVVVADLDVKSGEKLVAEIKKKKGCVLFVYTPRFPVKDYILG